MKPSETGHRRMATGFLSLLLLLIFLSSSQYLAKESLHECTGIHCAVCENLEHCEEILHRSEGAVLCIVLLLLAVCFSGSPERIPAYCRDTVTLHSLKIRLND